MHDSSYNSITPLQTHNFDVKNKIYIPNLKESLSRIVQILECYMRHRLTKYVSLHTHIYDKTHEVNLKKIVSFFYYFRA